MASLTKPSPLAYLVFPLVLLQVKAVGITILEGKREVINKNVSISSPSGEGGENSNDVS